MHSSYNAGEKINDANNSAKLRTIYADSVNATSWSPSLVPVAESVGVGNPTAFGHGDQLVAVTESA